jgi:hypothetical protein
MRAMNKGFILAMVFVLMSTSAFAYTFKGRVIDAQTKEPVEGAAVVVYWYKEKSVLVDTVQSLKDVKETLTDKNGEWTIEGPEGHELGSIRRLIPFVSYTLKPEFIIFKPGYCSVPKKASLLDACKGMKFHGGNRLGQGMTVELPRLTEREDRIKAQNVSPLGSGKKWDKKQGEFIKLLNKERRYLGFGEY